MDRVLFEELGLHRQFGAAQGVSFLLASANGRATSEIEAATRVAGDADYHPCPEASPAADVPKGQIITLEGWAESAVFADTSRDIAVYKPANCGAGQSLPVLLCFDGALYIDADGPVRAAAVLDSLIHQGSLPPMMAVFVDPGLPQPLTRGDLAAAEFDAPKQQAADQRSLEYDSLDDRNTRFVLEDVLPLAEKVTGLKVSANPAQNIVCGMSSGGIAAFTVAWRAPHIFGCVLSHCGSYVNLRGGHNYPYLVRTTERKPLKVYLQSGAGDADITFGSWPLANQQMAAALKFAGYEFHFEFGTGGHTLRHAGAVFAQSLKWLVG